MRESLDKTPEAARVDWTVSPAHLLGALSPSVPWLPLRRVWHSRGVFSDTTRGIEQTGMRVHKSFSGVAFTNATVSRGPCSTATSTRNRCLVQLMCCDQQPKSSQLRMLGEDGSLNVIGRPFRPRDASVYPLDNRGLIGVSRARVGLLPVPSTTTRKCLHPAGHSVRRDTQR